MTDSLTETLSRLGSVDVPAALRRGIEKESLRVDADGRLSDLPHPAELGSALTHPHITTDFSEAQLELITGVHGDTESVLAELTAIHDFTFQNIGDEILWVASMPCSIGSAEGIPLGQYGRSHVGQSKTVYRRGLAHRYGAPMQLISGIHYNFSIEPAVWDALAPTGTADKEFITESYFSLIRNFRRHSWLLLYLFGASPALCRSFLPDPSLKDDFETHDEGTLFKPYATSLRMGPLGYQSDAQSSLHISYNSLDSYARSMLEALTTPWPDYQAIGIKVDGAYRQLNDTLIQIENEFYGTIRPKRRTAPGERPLEALMRRGVEYVEVRCVDLNPFEPIGIDAVEARFIDIFLLHCLLTPSAADTQAESREMHANQHAVVAEGRRPGLSLKREGHSVLMRDWATELLQECRTVAETIDHGSTDFAAAVGAQLTKVEDPDATPSAAILKEILSGQPFAQLALRQSQHHAADFRSTTNPGRIDMFARQAVASITEQAAVEAADEGSFDDYLDRYLALDLPDLDA